MKSLQVTSAKPNPSGKDRSRSGQATPAQLGGEWVDVTNVGVSPVDLKGVNLCHVAYKNDGTTEWAVVAFLGGVLKPRETLRVHSGSGPLQALHAADQQGVQWHSFTGNNYVWNNDKGDVPLLWDTTSKTTIDQTFYDPNPPEGFVLRRVGQKLQAV
jgi:hypothetical protein